MRHRRNRRRIRLRRVTLLHWNLCLRLIVRLWCRVCLRVCRLILISRLMLRHVAIVVTVLRRRHRLILLTVAWLLHRLHRLIRHRHLRNVAVLRIRSRRPHFARVGAGVAHVADDISISDDFATNVTAAARRLAGRAGFAARLLGEQIESRHHAAHLAAIFFHLHPQTITEAGLASVARGRARLTGVALAEEARALNRRQTGGWHGRLSFVLRRRHLTGGSQQRQSGIVLRYLMAVEWCRLDRNYLVTATVVPVVRAMQLATDKSGGQRDAGRCQQASAK